MTSINEMSYTSYITAMDDYIESLKKRKEQNPENAKTEAIHSLIEAGLFFEDGTPKSEICDQ